MVLESERRHDFRRTPAEGGRNSSPESKLDLGGPGACPPDIFLDKALGMLGGF